jgi:hypothetical protein
MLSNTGDDCVRLECDISMEVAINDNLQTLQQFKFDKGEESYIEY